MARIDTALDKVLPPRASRESRTLSLAGDRVLRRLPTTLDEVSEAVGAACVRTAALVNGPAALRLLAGYASDPRDRVQKELADVWRYFDAEEYAKTVLADAPLRNGRIVVERQEHVALVGHLAKLTALQVQDLLGAENLDWIRGVPYLESLNVSVIAPLDLSVLREHRGLTSLFLQGSGVDGGFDVLRELPSIEELLIRLGGDVRSVDFLRWVPTVTHLWLPAMKSVDDLEPICALPRLKRLYLGRCATDPAPFVVRCGTLTELNFFREALCGGLRSIESLLPQLTMFGVFGGSIGDPAPLARLAQVVSLNLQNTDIADLRPVANLPRLRFIYLGGCETELDLSPLAALPQRVVIRLSRRQKVRGLDAVRGRHRIVRG